MKNYILIACTLMCLSLSGQAVHTIFDQAYFPESSLRGAYCPNSIDDHIGSGGLDFDGGVDFSQQNRWLVETTASGSTLYLEIDFSFRGRDKPNVFVRGNRRLAIYKYVNNTSSIVGFRQTRPNIAGYTPWLTSARGTSSWSDDGDGGIFCEDDNLADISGISGGGGLNNSIFFMMDIQGDTGGSDISTDKNCECDTRVLKIYWERNIQVAIAPDRDRDGIQDTLIFDGLPVDRNIGADNELVTVTINLDGKRISGNIHNNDCRRLFGTIGAVIVDAQTNRKYPSIGSDLLIDWNNGRSDKDFHKRNMGNVQSNKVMYRVPRNILETGGTALILTGNSLRQCHKKCDLCSGYHCRIHYQNSQEIPLNAFIRDNALQKQAFSLKINARNNDGHYLELPLSVTY